MKSKVSTFVFLAVMSFLTLQLFPAFAQSPPRTIAKEGVLTAFEEGDGAIIDDQGYLLSPGLKIVDGQGEMLYRGTFTLPVPVRYEFRYTADGPVIVRMTINPEDRK